MKKIVALALCLVMVIGLMTGCQKAMDAKTLVQKMDEAMKTVTEVGTEAEIDLEMKLSASGVTMGMALGMDMDMKAKTDFSQLYADMSVSMEMLGQTEETAMEMYMTMVDGNAVAYVLESETETWVKTAMVDYAELLAQAQGAPVVHTFSNVPAEKLSLDKEKVTVNDRECYVLTVDLDGEFFKSYMDENMDEAFAQMDEEMAKAEAEMSEEELEQTKSMMEAIKNLDWSTLSAKSVYHVDAETFLPVETSVEILGLGETMQSILNALLAELMIELDSAELEFSIDIPTSKMTVKNMVYNEAVEIPAVPQEAIDNAIDADEMADEEFVVDESLLNNPAQADGSYLLTCEGDSVSVRIPEGYIPVMSELDNLEIMTPDYLNSGNYALVEEVTDEYLREYVNEMLTYAQEGEYYLSHTEPAELNGFTVATQIYNDGTGAVYAWRQLDATVLLVEVFFTGESFDTEALLSGLEIIAE